MGQARIDWTGDASDALKEIARLQGQVGKLHGKLANVRREARGARQGHTAAFGSGALRELKSFATGVIGISAAVAAVTQAFGQASQARKEFAAELRGSTGGLKRLVQVAGSQAEYQQLEKLSKALAVREGVNVGAAADLVFQAKSQGLLGDVDLLAQTQRFTDAQAMIASVGKAQAAFGRGEAGDTRQLLSKFLAAAAGSNVSVEQIARAASISSAGAARIGASDEEQLALLSVLSPAFKSPETASQRIMALSSVLAKGVEVKTGRKVRDESGRLVDETRQEQFTEGGFLQGMRRYQQRFPQQWQKALLGREEAAAVVEIIEQQRGAIDQRLAEIVAAQQTGAPLALALALTEGGTLGQVRRTASAKQAALLSGEGAGQAELELEAQRSRFSAEMWRRGGMSVPLGYLTQAGYGIEGMFAGPQHEAARYRSRFAEGEATIEGAVGAASNDVGRLLEDIANSNRAMAQQQGHQGLRRLEADD